MCEYSDQIDENRAKLLRGAQKHLPVSVYDKMAADEEGFYVAYSIDSPGRVSYARVPEDKYNYKRRQVTSLGRFLTRNLGIKMGRWTKKFDDAGNPIYDGPTDEHVAKVIAECIDIGACFELRTDVYNVYCADWSPESCMSGHASVKWYEENNVKILVYTEPDGECPRARALVWQDKYVDRIYPNDPKVVAAYEQYAGLHGLFLLENNGRGSNWGPDGLRSVKMKHSLQDVYPYLDTLYWYTAEGNGCTLSVDETDGALSMNMTDGRLPRVCDECGGFDEEGYYEYSGQSLCSECGGHLRWCDYCNQYVDGSTQRVRYGHACGPCFANIEAERARNVAESTPDCCTRCSSSCNTSCDHRVVGQLVCCDCSDAYDAGRWIPDTPSYVDVPASIVVPAGTLVENVAGLSYWLQTGPESGRIYSRATYGQPVGITGEAEL